MTETTLDMDWSRVTRKDDRIIRSNSSGDSLPQHVRPACWFPSWRLRTGSTPTWCSNARQSHNLVVTQSVIGEIFEPNTNIVSSIDVRDFIYLNSLLFGIRTIEVRTITTGSRDTQWTSQLQSLPKKIYGPSSGRGNKMPLNKVVTNRYDIAKFRQYISSRSIRNWWSLDHYRLLGKWRVSGQRIPTPYIRNDSYHTSYWTLVGTIRLPDWFQLNRT